MAGGNRHQVDNYRVCCTIGVDGDPGGLNRNIRDFTGFTNANHKADVPGPLNEVQKTVAIVFAEDNPRQKLALMQGVPFKPARRQPVIALLLQPLQVGQVDGGDLNAGNIGQHLRRGIIVTVGHTHPGLRLFFKQSDGQRLTALHQFIKGVNPRRPHADDGNSLHDSLPSCGQMRH
ncbi:Uncharacterised protein [Klebsiella pneumoniae]|nr:Uncharacterised protein [Klebsiella pneumoniae]